MDMRRKTVFGKFPSHPSTEARTDRPTVNTAPEARAGKRLPVGYIGPMANSTIAGRCGILTGASSGIGRALATQLIRQGARLIVVARRTERWEGLARGLAGASGEVAILL